MSEIELLEKIVANTAHKTSFQIIVSNNKSIFNTKISPTIELDHKLDYKVTS